MVCALMLCLSTMPAQVAGEATDLVRFVTKQSKTYTIEGHEWTFRVIRDELLTGSNCYVWKDGHLVVKTKGAGSSCFKRCWYPAPWPVFYVGEHSGAGHGQSLEFYAIEDGEARLLVKTDSECGGPVFRDFDGDGVMEWVFDDYNYYEDGENPPKHILVYKVNDSGGLDLWKTLPNRYNVENRDPICDWF